MHLWLLAFMSVSALKEHLMPVRSKNVKPPSDPPRLDFFIVGPFSLIDGWLIGRVSKRYLMDIKQGRSCSVVNYAYRSPKTFSIGLSPKLVNPLDFRQLRWHFVRKIRWITLKITILGETHSDKIATCIVTKRGDHIITLIVTNSGRSPKKSPYGVK